MTMNDLECQFHVKIRFWRATLSRATFALARLSCIGMLVVNICPLSFIFNKNIMLWTGIESVGCIQSVIHNVKQAITMVYTDNYAYRANNFVVGLTNASPRTSAPTLWQYTLCGQYPGAVPAAATVSLYCPYNLPPFRYVIVQFPITDHLVLCELEVIAPGRPMWLSYHDIRYQVFEMSSFEICIKTHITASKI